MKSRPDRPKLPEKAVWSREGTDPAADARWLAGLQPTARHYRLYLRESPYDCPQPSEPGEPDGLDLFGVVLIDADKIEESRGGLLLPSPSMIGHLLALRAASAEWDGAAPAARDPAAPIPSYRRTGGAMDAYRFDPAAGYLLGGVEVTQDRMQWQSVRLLGPVKRCPACNRVLPMRYATHCVPCGAWFSTTFDLT